MRIIDVGCGPGIYVKALRDAGFDADGIDIEPNPYTRLDIFSDKFTQLYSYREYDLVICIEVAEHIPESHSKELVSRLTHLSDTILFSAAVPGQGGDGHINLHPKDYWIDLYSQQNYYQDVDATNKFVSFMMQGYHMGWLTNNAIIFKSYGKLNFNGIVKYETP